MFIDPNRDVNTQSVFVLCENGAVHLHDGRQVPRSELSSPGNAFDDLCRGLDPNIHYIAALVPEREDNDLFFEAREQARKIGLHMQSTVEKPDLQRQRWETYKRMKALPKASADE